MRTVCDMSAAPSTRTDPERSAHRVAIALADRPTLLSLAAPVDVFAPRPWLADPWYEVQVCAAGPVEVGGWGTLGVTGSLEDLVGADTVVLTAPA